MYKLCFFVISPKRFNQVPECSVEINKCNIEDREKAIYNTILME